MAKEGLTDEKQKELNDKLLEATRNPETTAEDVSALIGAGVDVNAKDELSRTALHWAAEKGHTEVVGALLKIEGIEVNTQDKWGKTALHIAAQNGHTEVVSALIKKGADVKAIDQFGRTALHWATEKRHAKVVGALIDKGADVNAKDQFGRTALHVLAEKVDVSKFATSLATIPDESLATVLTTRDKNGKRPLDILVEKVEDPDQKKELAKIAKHIGGILRERNPALKKHASLWQGLTDVYQSFCDKIGITTERARVRDDLGLQTTDSTKSSTEFVSKLRESLSKKVSTPSSLPSTGGGRATHGRS
jgi:hypothetical protein